MMKRRTLIKYSSALAALRADLQGWSANPRSPVIASPGKSRGPGGVDTPREHIQVLVRTTDTDGRFSVLAFDAPPLSPHAAGPPLHMHRDVDEWLYVEKGDFLVEIDGKRYRIGTGGAILAPMGLPHRYIHCASVPGRIVVNYSPGGRMEEFFEIDKTTDGVRWSQQKLRAVYGQFHMELLGPPLTSNEVENG